MGWSEMEARCKKHPKHRQSKGVCPSCLRERLSHISTSTSTNTTSSSISSPYSYDDDSISSSSSAPSSSASPSHHHHRRHHHRHRHHHHHRGTKAKMSLLMKQNGENPLLGKPEPLTKSRSLAFVFANPVWDRKKGVIKSEKTKEEEKEKKKGGFWSMLGVGSKKRGKEKDVSLHSKTMRETSSSRWVMHLPMKI